MRNQFLSLFSPRRYLQTRSEVQLPSGKTGRKQWVVARSLCFYQVFVMGDVPPSERREALNVRIREWSPFSETGRYVVWRDETAMVWIWDDHEMRQKAQALKVPGTKAVPEPLLWGLPEGDGLRVLKCLEGIEAQMWKGEVMTTSRWWAKSPPAEEWSRFMLALDLNPTEPFKDASELVLLDRPWAATSEGTFVLNLRYEASIVSMGLLVFAFFLVWHVTGIVRWHGAIGALDQRITTLSRQVEPLLNARTCALDYRQKAGRLLSVASYPSQMELMAAVAGKFPYPGVVLMEWHYNRGHLSLVLQGNNLDPSYIVSAYEELAFFGDVIAERGQKPDRLDVKMVVKEKGNK